MEEKENKADLCGPSSSSSYSSSCLSFPSSTLLLPHPLSPSTSQHPLLSSSPFHSTSSIISITRPTDATTLMPLCISHITTSLYLLSFTPSSTSTIPYFYKTSLSNRTTTPHPTPCQPSTCPCRVPRQSSVSQQEVMAGTRKTVVVA
ncbi:hypothetical protein E2C01_050489 [Portunus trituberculatus]|uniref:Uncharacterized protein n=1 Tax=Portunus trituberculatus TaxID=210409 RepID=A0A5B7GGX3_PORTR|nr:hypothetical protein [Portunus trituberculatus]